MLAFVLLTSQLYLGPHLYYFWHRICTFDHICTIFDLAFVLWTMNLNFTIIGWIHQRMNVSENEKVTGWTHHRINLPEDEFAKGWTYVGWSCRGWTCQRIKFTGWKWEVEFARLKSTGWKDRSRVRIVQINGKYNEGKNSGALPCTFPHAVVCNLRALCTDFLCPCCYFTNLEESCTACYERHRCSKSRRLRYFGLWHSQCIVIGKQTSFRNAV